MVRRLGCALALAVLSVGAVLAALVWLVLSVAGVIGSAPFARVVAGAGVLLGVAAVAVAAALVRRAAARAGRLVDAARRIEAGDYSARVPVRGPSEVRSLARAFNAMSSRLEAEEARRRSVLADVAHELRTPLTVIRGQAEAIVDGVYPATPDQMAPILAATHTLEGLVADLRTLALADAGSLRLEREPVDVAVLLHDSLDAFRSAADAAGVTMTADIASDLPPVDGDPARLRSVLSNLLANALRHTPPGGTIGVTAAAAGGVVRLTVRDDGEGIAPELLPRVFDRFVKSRASNGSGLGLAIVRDIVEAHGGAATVDSKPGQGTAVSLTLPAV
jgi:signal transduction histidine kinase